MITIQLNSQLIMTIRSSLQSFCIHYVQIRLICNHEERLCLFCIGMVNPCRYYSVRWWWKYFRLCFHCHYHRIVSFQVCRMFYVYRICVSVAFMFTFRARVDVYSFLLSAVKVLVNKIWIICLGVLTFQFLAKMSLLWVS